jgi:hypothetical protein
MLHVTFGVGHGARYIFVFAARLLLMANPPLPPKPAAAIGNTDYISTSGNSAWPGTPAQPWSAVQHAANVLQPGDTVTLRGGTYHQQWCISRTTQLGGCGGGDGQAGRCRTG